MASLPSQHPTLSLHLTDRALNPILTSARSQSQLESLTSLTTTALTAHAAASRLNLGAPTRMIVEHGPGAPVVLASFLNAEAAFAATNGTERRIPGAEAEGEAAGGEGEDAGERRNGHEREEQEARDGDERDAAPMLVGIVVAGSSDEAMDARRAAGRLERVGREVQREWVTEERRDDDDDGGD